MCKHSENVVLIPIPDIFIPNREHVAANLILQSVERQRDFALPGTAMLSLQCKILFHADLVRQHS